MFERVLVTARHLYPRSRFAETVLEAADRHDVSMIVVREKDLDAEDLRPMAADVVVGASVPVIVAHAVDVAEATGAAGVHLGWNSGSIAAARRRLGAEALIGVSVHGVNEGVTRAAEGADYLFIGPVNPTPKPRPTAPIGLTPVAELASKVEIPVVAIGGLSTRDVPAVRDAGASGIAAIRSFI